MICVKTFDTQAAVDDLRPYGSRFRHILSLQNGLSNEDILSQAFGADKVIAGTITHPVVVPEPGVVRSEKKKGGIGVALVNGQNAESWADTLNKTGIVTRAYADYRAMKWSKLLLNIIGNATSAMLNMNTVRVFADRRLVWLEAEQLREAIRRDEGAQGPARVAAGLSRAAAGLGRAILADAAVGTGHASARRERARGKAAVAPDRAEPQQRPVGSGRTQRRSGASWVKAWACRRPSMTRSPPRSTC